MKFISILLFIFSMSILFPSCKDTQAGYDMVYTQFFNIQAGANPWETHFFENTVNARWAEFLGTLTVDDLSEINPSFAELTNNLGINLDFVNRVTIEIYPNEDTSLQPWEMAFRENVPFNTGTTLNLVPTIAPFKDELADDEFIFRIGLQYREFPPQTFQVELNFGFRALTK